MSVLPCVLEASDPLSGVGLLVLLSAPWLGDWIRPFARPSSAVAWRCVCGGGDVAGGSAPRPLEARGSSGERAVRERELGRGEVAPKDGDKAEKDVDREEDEEEDGGGGRLSVRERAMGARVAVTICSYMRCNRP